MDNERISDYSWKVHRSLLRRDLVAGSVSLNIRYHHLTYGLHGVRSEAILVRGGIRCHLPGSPCFDQIG